MSNRDLCFLDTETTGFKPGYIWEICMRRFQVPDALFPLVEVDSFYSRFWIPPDAMHPKAAAVNGWTPDKTAEAPWFSDHAERMAEVMNECTLVIKNVAFDTRFLEAEFERACVDPGYHYSPQELGGLFLVEKHIGLIPDLKQSTICNRLGMTAQTHRACSDVDQMVAMYVLSPAFRPQVTRAQLQIHSGEYVRPLDFKRFDPTICLDLAPALDIPSLFDGPVRIEGKIVV